MSLRARLVALVMVLAALGVSPAGGQVLRLDDRSPRSAQVLRRGAVEVSVQQRRRRNEAGFEGLQPLVVVRLRGVAVGRMLGARGAGGPAAVVQIAEMDPGNPYPEVLRSSFTGGAHCCNQIQMLTSDRTGEPWREVRLGPFNGGARPAEDPLRSGRDLIVDVDHRFLSCFGCDACSAAPARLWPLQADAFIDVSHRPETRPLHRRNLRKMAPWFEQKRAESPSGFLAAYLANKALVGEFKDGWERMLKRHDRTSDWGLKDCKGEQDYRGMCQGREIVYGSFPEALRAFLVETGDLSRSAQP
ncbi:MAG: hypothetical protein ACKO0M_13380 [Cyanobium sp.]